ncbi:hypothetical protein GLAREA_04728 [Glarea lozoyensis ATCC 20868]|uniref:Thymidylate kinase protein n=2 Tax=Glarea lozoyensis TaxID=101852 RepID=S3CN84_GLAL2|nr:uncharacterized protein GLAREA_04728 [Glarea lozoyensis ATCC 20868]EHL01955.1 hypothetical protein M7I_1904 [Glarea lozoyensis 74030]EPE27937.1 hypothetical protein GLAREA_04728 [Glarea lozoyensis ATCC 20868]
MATHMSMPATRQPFAPLNNSRLQNLTSLKNRQNGTFFPYTPYIMFLTRPAVSSPVKRKATSFESDNDDSENVDPILFLSPKRSKAQDGSSKDPSAYIKPVNFYLTKAAPSSNDFSSIKNTPVSPQRRPILPARSPAPKINTTIKSTPLSAPAGRSPTRKRIGILNRRKTGSPFTRIEPPKFSTPTPSGLSFSIDAALSNTISSRKPITTPTPVSLKDNAHLIPTLHTAAPKESWFFEIHEDTAEELATNLMEHSTCTLDISSDEESAQRLRDDRGKENVPPMDDISQTRTAITSSVDVMEEQMSDLKARIRARRSRDENAIEVDRSPLGDLAAEDFYAAGCDEKSIFVILPDETAEDEVPVPEDALPVAEDVAPLTSSFDFVAEVKGKSPVREQRVLDIDALMRKDDEVAPKAALLEPIERAEEGFEVWESGSAKDEEL